MIKKHIYILATGGTIAGRAASEEATTGYEAGAIGIAELLEAVPELTRYAEVEGEQVAAIDSKDMRQEIWLCLAARCEALLAREDVDGIVITHGTDTMEETAYFLHLTVHSEKPIVLTGAMRPATAMSADGPMNLLQAVRVAADDEAAGKGVLIVLNGTIESARDAVKTHTTSLDTFRSPEMGLLGSVQDGEPVFYRSPLRRHTVHSASPRCRAWPSSTRMPTTTASSLRRPKRQVARASSMRGWATAASPSAWRRHLPRLPQRASPSCAARAARPAA